jgi:hypothetical protein
MQVAMIAWSPEATNSIAGGNATGIDGNGSDPEGVAQPLGKSSTLSGSHRLLLRSGGVATGY